MWECETFHLNKRDTSHQIEMPNNIRIFYKSTQKYFSDCETPSRLKKFFFSCHNSNNLNGTLVLSDGTIEDWKAMLDVNVLALCICTAYAVKSMKKHNVDGHIININGIAGDYVPNVSQFSVYPASKHAVRAFSESLRRELARDGRKIKISVIAYLHKIKNIIKYVDIALKINKNNCILTNISFTEILFLQILSK